MTRLSKFVVLLVLLAGMVGCHPPQPVPQAAVVASPIDYAHELPPGVLALRKLSPGEYPDFSQAVTASNVGSLATAIDHSLAYLATPTSKQFFPYEDIDHDRAVASLTTLKQIVQQVTASPPTDGGHAFDALIKSTFEVYQSIGAPDPGTNRYTGQVLFTGYFTPIYNGSMTRTGPFQFPLYKRPADLVMNAAGDQAAQRSADGTLAPYSTRQQIEQNHVLDGQELCFLGDRFDAYVITVQGSARIRLPDGSIYEVGYNGNNGYAYTSPGRQMLADGVITKEQLNLRGLRAYFAAHPEAMDKYLPLNQRYIFFSERRGGPFGSLNEPVTPFTTIATDKSVYPRAMPAFVVGTVPSDTSDQPVSYRALMFDQDTGGGIRAAGRCDLYMGVGDAAERLAGRELATGQLYYLAIKPQLIQPQTATN